MAKQAVDEATKELQLDFHWPYKAEAEKLLQQIVQELDGALERRTKMLLEMNELEAAGIEFFGTTYKNGKYLYKLYPSTAGEARKRVYVGADHETIKTEMAKLDRYHKHAKLKRELEELESTMRRRVLHLQRAKNGGFW